MTHPPDTSEDPRNDTPQGASRLDEFEPPPWRRWLKIALVAVAIIVTVWVTVRFWRMITRLTSGMFGGADADVTYGPMPDGGAGAGAFTKYRLHFYDGDYPQLTRPRRFMEIDESLPTDAIGRQLEARTRALQAEVERLDSQRCFNPRLELRDDAGAVKWRWP
jgi:hypothetical protein